MASGVFIGIDTSNYTTSAAGLCSDGEVFCAKRPLEVPQGARGMRQSDALFCHTRDLKEVLAALFSEIREKKGNVPVLAVAASSTPRRVEGSYMPCFLAGVSAAAAMAEGLGVPFLQFSHQEGHIEAVRLGAEKEGKTLPQGPFLAFHLSGGTTELLLVEEDEKRYNAALLAEVLDLTLGQLIDRSGVKLGLPFPAGAPLEALAKKSNKKFRVKIPVRENGINLSGFENRFDQMLKNGESPEDAAGFIFTVAGEAVKALLSLAGREDLPVLFSGGVSSSEILKTVFSGERYFFAPPIYSADNAMGIASLCRKGVQNGSLS